WRDVIVGAVATAILFTIGKSLIGIYIGRMNVAESYGTAGSLIVILLWIYDSTVTFLLGAEFTRVYAERFGSHAEHPAAEAERVAPRQPQPAPEPRPALAASPDALARRTASTRAEIDQTWRVIREQVPEPPVWRTKRAADRAAERPSWLQIAVAGLAVAVLPAPSAERNDCNLACRARGGPDGGYGSGDAETRATGSGRIADNRPYHRTGCGGPADSASVAPASSRTRAHRCFTRPPSIFRRQHSALRCP